MNHLPLIIKREYLAKVRNKSFIIMTILSPIIVIGLIAIVAYLSHLNNDKVRVISILDESGLVNNVFKTSPKTHYNNLTGVSLDEAKALVKASSGYGLLHIKPATEIKELAKGIKFYAEGSPSLSVVKNLERKLQKHLTTLNYQNSGVDMSKIKALQVNVSIYQENFKGEVSSKTDGFYKLIFGGVSGYLLFMFIIIYGNMIMRSVIEEKTSRIIEVIISSVKPVQLMLGKIIGTSLAGITQFAIWIILGSILMILVSLILGIEITQMETPQQALLNQTLEASSDLQTLTQGILQSVYSLPLTNLIIAFVLFFVSGYFLYSSFYATIGAAVDSETDTQQFMMPVIMPLILAVYIGFFTVIEDPHGTVSVIFSFIPLTSPVVMLMRIPFGVPLWQQLLSLVILIITFIGTVQLAAKIYRIGILMYGKKPTYKDIIKWIKY